MHVARTDPPAGWRAIVALPREPLSTSKARAVLPASFPLDDVVANLQSVAVLSLAFARGRADLLRLAMRDRIHQTHRASMCPLLPVLLPLVGKQGIVGVALSGAGPAILAIVEGEEHLAAASTAVQNQLVGELLICRFSRRGACQIIEK